MGERFPTAWLPLVLDKLPVAVGIFDRTGRFVFSGGGLRTVWGDVIPAFDPNEAVRWQVIGAKGHRLDPAEWPEPRALRGEIVVPGVTGIYLTPNGIQSSLLIASIPFNDGQGFQGGATFLQDLGAKDRARADVPGTPSSWFADAHLGAMREPHGHAEAYPPRAQRRPSDDGMAPPKALTGREAQVMRLIAWGKSHKEIANELGISPKTVQFHRSGAVEKLGLRSRGDLLRFALSRGWVGSTLLGMCLAKISSLDVILDYVNALAA